MGVDTYVVCRTCRRVMDFYKFLEYQMPGVWCKSPETTEGGDILGVDVTSHQHFDLNKKFTVLAKWLQEHTDHEVYLVHQDHLVMEECHHGWTYEAWDGNYKEVRNVPERPRTVPTETW